MLRELTASQLPRQQPELLVSHPVPYITTPRMSWQPVTAHRVKVPLENCTTVQIVGAIEQKQRILRGG